MSAALRRLQRDFLAYLLHDDAAIATQITGSDQQERTARLSIYHSAYRQRLRSCMETDHPVLSVYLGDELFDRLVACYVVQAPSRQPSLRQFCDRLPRFLSTTAPFSEHPVLSDLAHFERRLLSVFDAAEAPRVQRTALLHLPPAAWPGLGLRFHPSVERFTSTTHCVPIWQALKGDRTPPAAAAGSRQHWLIWRNRERVSEFRGLQQDEHAALAAAMAGGRFAEICQGLLQWHELEPATQRAAALLARWIEDGLITTLQPSATDIRAP